MPLKVEYFKDKFIEDNYQTALNELNKFFDFNWIHNTPRVFIVDSRQSFDELLGYKTPDWVVGSANSRNIYLLDRKKYGTETKNHYSDKSYVALIKHEICHLFFTIFTNKHQPLWLSEGVSIYVSGQNKFKKKPSEFKTFLKFYSINSDKEGNVYAESGFVIETLVNNFGKEKLIKLIKSCKVTKTEKSFKQSFKKIYGIDLSYKNINKLYNQKS